MTDSAAVVDNVFINCPFDDAFAPIFRAMIFSIYVTGFRPRSALELDDGSQTRIDKIYGLIEICRYGIHDLSRTEPDPVHNLPRFNMPLELGLFLGAKRFGNREQKNKRVLILDREQYRYQRFISDLAGMDIRAHDADVTRAIGAVRDWLGNVSRRTLPSADRVVAMYQAFSTALLMLAAELQFDPNKIPYTDFERMLAGWLLQTPPL